MWPLGDFLAVKDWLQDRHWKSLCFSWTILICLFISSTNEKVLLQRELLKPFLLFSCADHVCQQGGDERFQFDKILSQCWHSNPLPSLLFLVSPSLVFLGGTQIKELCWQLKLCSLTELLMIDLVQDIRRLLADSLITWLISSGDELIN